jgi:hypothetical protein
MRPDGYVRQPGPTRLIVRADWTSGPCGEILTAVRVIDQAKSRIRGS